MSRASDTSTSTSARPSKKARRSSSTRSPRSSTPCRPSSETAEIPLEALEKKQDNGFTIRVEDGIYIVEAEWLVPILSKIDYDDYESLQYLQRVLQSSGIDQALQDNGIEDGDTVSLYDIEFDYVT